MRLECNNDVNSIALLTFRQTPTLGYFACGYLQAEADKRKPKDLATLKYAIRKCARETPLSGYTRSKEYYGP